MPRTKKPVSRKERKSADTESLKHLDSMAAGMKDTIRIRTEKEIEEVELAFKMLLSSVPQAYMKKTIGQLKAELAFLTSVTHSEPRAPSQDDGYLTANSSSGSAHGTKGKMPPRVRRSRSVARPPPSVTRAPRASSARSARSVYQTPAYKNKNTLPVVTPKVAPQTPLMLVRQVRDGEMVISMSGSPVMPANYMPSEEVNCNIRLQDGTLLSLQPHEFRQSQAFIPFSLMDGTVWDKIKTMKDNLDKMVKLREMAPPS